MINVRTCDAAIFLKGSIGTLNEFTIAVKEEKIIGVLENSGGISSKIKSFLEGLELNYNPKIYYSDSIYDLMDKIMGELDG